MIDATGPDPQRNGFLFPLRDGRSARFRPVQPGDGDRLKEGFRLLSRKSRYLRFFRHVTRLSDELVQQLTNVDPDHHIAWCALDPGRPELPGLGVGRLIRDEQEPSRSELALVVIDAYQSRGVGSTLLAILYLQAQQHQIQWLRASVLPENDGVLGWLSRLGATVHYDPETDSFEVDVPVFSAVEQAPVSTPSAARFQRLLLEVRDVMFEGRQSVS